MGLGEDEGGGVGDGGGSGGGVGVGVGEAKGVAVIQGVIVGVGVGVGVDDGVGVVLLGVALVGVALTGVGVGVGEAVGVGVVSDELLLPSLVACAVVPMRTVFSISPAVILNSPVGNPPVFILTEKKPSEPAVTWIFDVIRRFTEVASSAALPYASTFFSPLTSFLTPNSSTGMIIESVAIPLVAS